MRAFARLWAGYSIHNCFFSSKLTIFYSSYYCIVRVYYHHTRAYYHHTRAYYRWLVHITAITLVHITHTRAYYRWLVHITAITLVHITADSCILPLTRAYYRHHTRAYYHWLVHITADLCILPMAGNMHESRSCILPALSRPETCYCRCNGSYRDRAGNIHDFRLQCTCLSKKIGNFGIRY